MNRLAGRLGGESQLRYEEAGEGSEREDRRRGAPPSRGPHLLHLQDSGGRAGVIRGGRRVWTGVRGGDATKAGERRGRGMSQKKVFVACRDEFAEQGMSERVKSN
jgi:hypothetical protein